MLHVKYLQLQTRSAIEMKPVSWAADKVGNPCHAQSLPGYPTQELSPGFPGLSLRAVWIYRDREARWDPSEESLLMAGAVQGQSIHSGPFPLPIIEAALPSMPAPVLKEDVYSPRLLCAWEAILWCSISVPPQWELTQHLEISTGNSLVTVQDRTCLMLKRDPALN